MKWFIKLIFPVIIFFSIFPSFVLGIDSSTITKIVVADGNVICFDLPKELAEVEREESFIGKFVERIDEETGRTDIKGEISLCYIPQEYRTHIGDKLQSGVYIFLLKNIRRLKQTEWDIISVGTVVSSGKAYENGLVRTATKNETASVVKEFALEPGIEAGAEAGVESNIATSTPSSETAIVNKSEQSEGSGEGKATPTPEPPTPPTPPSEPTQPETTTTPYEGPDYYVNPNGSDSNDGSSGSPWKTIQYAINKIGAGETATIHLATGIYGAVGIGGNGESFPLTDDNTNITLKGDDRNNTTLNGGGSSIINFSGNITVTLDSLTMTNANGGAVSIAVTSGTITNCTISNNTAAGGICAGITNNGNMTISNCTIENNTQTGSGGAGATSWSGAITVTGCTFNNNDATGAGATGPGALWINDTIVNPSTVSNCTFTNNSSTGYGGAIKIWNATVTISNCPFTSNSCSGAGGGGAINIGGGSTTTINNSTFTSNSVSAADVGGAIYNENATTTINSCTFKNNTGCAIRKGTIVPAMIDNDFFGNNRIENLPATTYDCYYDGTTYYSADGAGGLPSINGVVPGSTGNEDLLADPPITGKVYDSVTGENISSPVVAIYDATTNAQVAVTTDNPFTFNVDPGKYYFAVSKTGYAFPSQIVSSTTSGDHGDIFTAANDALTINIPMDSDGWLVVEKTCNKKRVETGDIVTYRIKVQNKHWYKSVENVELVDELVNGFKYIGNPVFNLGTVSANSTQIISYQVRVGSGIPSGRYKTSCNTRKTTTLARNSNISSVNIEVIENPLFTKGTIIGKVFWDINGNGVQDKGEKGLGGVKIYTEYGVVVETDIDGKYHIADVPAGNHLLKLDTTELPNWVKLTTDNPYYVKITEGLLAKVNFGITKNGDREKGDCPSTTLKGQSPFSLSPFFIVALAEGEIRNLATSGNMEMVEKDDRYDDGLKVDGRLALYLKGKILGKYLIKASIDTERRPYGRYDTKKLFTNLDPDKYYPVYGDASKIDYSGVDTQDVVYVIVEWDNSFAKWGSFHTELPLYNRTLSGGIINYNSIGKTKFGDTRTKIKGFGAFARQKPAHDEFVGTGGSLYYLRHDNIIEGSEKLRVEVRDRIGKIVTNSIPLAEEKDYEIDYDTGKVILKKPLNSVQQGYNDSIISNDVLMGERVYLVIDYEYYSNSMSDQGWGVNGSQWIGNHIRVGGIYVEEQKPETSNQKPDNYKLMGGDGTIKINKDTEINASYSRTEETQLGSTMSYDGGLTFTEQGDNYSLGKSGSAVSVDGKTKLFNNTDIFLSYSRQDPYYSVTSSISSQGSQKYLANIVTNFTENFSAGITHLTQRYFEGSIAGETFGATDSHTTTGILDYRKNKWDIRWEYQHQEVSNPITDYTYFGTLPLLSNDFIAARIGYQLFTWLHPYIRGQGTVKGEADNQGTVGADITILKNTTLNLAETVGNQGDSTLIGLTTKITEGTDVYANLEVGNNIRLGKFTKTTYGQSSILSPDSRAYIEEDYSSYRENIVRGNILGYDKKITDTLALGITYERSNVKNNISVINRDSGSIALSYLDPDWLKAYTKLELRNDRGTNEIRQWVTENDVLWRTTEWLTLSGRGNWGWTDNRTTEHTEARFYEIGTGFSIRPPNWDKLNILGKYSYLTDLPPDSKWDFPEDIESKKNVYSIEGIYDLFKYLSLVGKFTYRDMDEKVGVRDWTKSDTYLYIARTNFHISKKGTVPFLEKGTVPFLLSGWDFAVEYRVLSNTQIEDSKTGWLVELDKDLGNYIRCGVGYNFTDYDDDLRNDDNWDSKGWFFKLAGKY